METSAASAQPTYICQHCLAGTLRLQQVVFAHWYGGQFITIPNFPGWVCDVCGETEYDSVALEQVETILGTELDLRRAAGQRARRGARKFQPLPRSSGRHRV
jgi:YgiT-type zinc finger domain-containing protein